MSGLFWMSLTNTTLPIDATTQNEPKVISTPTETFCRVGICSWCTTGIGRQMTSTSEMMFKAA
jgi:hypothetical protein